MPDFGMGEDEVENSSGEEIPNGGTSDADGHADLTVVETKKKRFLNPIQRTTGLLCTNRYKARKHVEKGLTRLREVLVRQRQHYLSYCPSSSQVTLSAYAISQKKKYRDEVYGRLRDAEDTFTKALIDVRALEVELLPAIRDEPAVFAVGICAAGASWVIDQWDKLTPLPEVTECLRRVVVAAYSPPKNERVARLPRGVSVAAAQTDLPSGNHCGE